MEGRRIKWNFGSERALLHAMVGRAYGDSFEEAMPKLLERKAADAEKTAKRLDLKPNDILMEIGSGVGIVAKIFASEVKHVHCVDISEEFLDRCRKTLEGVPNVSFHLVEPGDLSALRGLGINKVYAEAVFIHFNFYDLVIYLSELHNILPSNGVVTFGIANADFRNLLENPQWLTQLSSYKRDKSSFFGLLSFHSPQAVTNCLRKCGFLTERIENFDELYVQFKARKIAK